MHGPNTSVAAAILPGLPILALVSCDPPKTPYGDQR
jgi:hypothetical protein